MTDSIITSFSALSHGVQDVKQWALLHYAFFAHKCAIKVTLKNGAVTVDPFVNVQYDNRNAWGDNKGMAKLKFKYGSVEDHYKEKENYFQENDSKDKGFVKDPYKWWLNGHSLCNVEQPNLWSLRGVKEIEEMLQCANINHIEGVFVINKRDSPILRNYEYDHPFPAIGKIWCHPIHIRPKRKPLSFYSGPLWADILFPIPEAWRWANHIDRDGGGFLLNKCFMEKGQLNYSEYNFKLSKAIFRGTATGAGLNMENQRIHLCSIKDLDDLMDCGITAWNKRDRVFNGVVDFQVPPTDFQLKSQMSPKDQSKYKYILCVDGHQAPSRLIWHLASGSTIILVDSSNLTLAPKMWIHKYLIENVHYVRVKSDLSDLKHVLETLSCGNIAYNIAKNAYEIAYTHLNSLALAKAAKEAIIESHNS